MWGAIGDSPLRWFTRSASVCTGMISTSPTNAASLASTAGTKARRIPLAAAVEIMAMMPGVWRTTPFERELAGHERILELRRGDDLVAGEEDAEGDRQVVGGSRLLQVGRRQVDRDPADREATAGVANGGADAVLALADRRIGQPDHDRPRHALADVDFDLDQHAVETDDRAREHLCQHVAPEIDSTWPRNAEGTIVA